MRKLSEAGREELALALILWKDFKAQGKMDVEVMKQAIGFAEHLGVRNEFESLLSKMPPLCIIERK